MYLRGMDAGVDFILVKVKMEIADTIKYKTLELYVDGDFDPTQHVALSGEVVGVPRALRRWAGKIDPIVKVGDLAYWDYRGINIDDDSRSVRAGEDIYYRIPYNFIQCVVRDGLVTVMNGRAFCQAIFDEDVVEIEGVGDELVKAKMTESGIITEINVKHNLRKATLAMLGLPVGGDFTLNAEIGDTVFYHPYADDEYTIEGEKYFVINQEDLLAKEL
jgi:co-chaperonin GroES (HSP10)